MKRKILFLDIDGVLNSEEWFLSDETALFRDIKNKKHPMYNHLWFDPKAIDRLTDIVNKTCCDIVISSSWRKNRSIELLREIFTAVDFKPSCFITGKTDSSFNWLQEGVHCPSIRGLEIRVWLELNVERTNPIYAETYNYCILDDDTDMLYEQKDNFVNTDARIGLSDDDVLRVIQILNKE